MIYCLVRCGLCVWAHFSRVHAVYIIFIFHISYLPHFWWTEYSILIRSQSAFLLCMSLFFAWYRAQVMCIREGKRRQENNAQHIIFPRSNIISHSTLHTINAHITFFLSSSIWLFVGAIPKEWRILPEGFNEFFLYFLSWTYGWYVSAHANTHINFCSCTVLRNVALTVYAKYGVFVLQHYGQHIHIWTFLWLACWMGQLCGGWPVIIDPNRCRLYTHCIALIHRVCYALCVNYTSENKREPFGHRGKATKSNTQPHANRAAYRSHFCILTPYEYVIQCIVATTYTCSVLRIKEASPTFFA